MMNNRILELLQQPQLIVPEDLKLLEKQIQQDPYVQNIRALYLYGVHQYLPQRYKEILTTTAAYTTDKKILYQFINQKEIQTVLAEKESEKLNLNQEIKEDAKVVVAPIIAEPKKEESITTKPLTEIVDVDKEETKPVEEVIPEVVKDIATEPEIENIEVVTTEPEAIINEEIVEELPIIEDDNSEEMNAVSQEEDLNFSKDIVVEAAQLPVETIESSKDISFESIDEFLPNVKFSVPKNHHTFLNPPKFEKVKDQEIILPEVTQKVEESKEDLTKVEIEIPKDANFHKAVNFGPFDHDEEKSEVVEAAETPIVIDSPKEVVDNNVVEDVIWTPMTLDNHVPDALIGKDKNIVAPVETPKIIEEVLPVVDDITDVDKQETSIPTVVEPIAVTTEESRPIMNVSFFSDAISIKPEEKIEEPETTTEENLQAEDSNKSNIGKFINTWQSWLKIDRTEEVVKEKEIVKNKVIEEFIVKQPKISQLKDEVNFVVKEKKEDISHLMTETFANLYLEQKLYTKAINAFEILIKNIQKIMIIS